MSFSLPFCLGLGIFFWFPCVWWKAWEFFRGCFLNGWLSARLRMFREVRTEELQLKVRLRVEGGGVGVSFWCELAVVRFCL